jgi:hypothetical protein
VGEKNMGRSLSEKANYVLQQFKLFGVDVPGGSRISDMYKAICNENGSSRGLILKTDADFNVAREALRDFSQLEFYFDQVKGLVNKHEHKSKLKEIVSGTTLPQDSGTNTPDRNAQAELFVFAVCKNADLEPSFQEPDITCKLDGKKYGVAVKRIKNLTQLEKRVNDGANQIERTELPGIVSVEITMAMNPENKSIFTTLDEYDVKMWWRQEFCKMVNNYHDNFYQRVAGKNVLGIFLHEHCPVRLGKNYELRTMNYGVSTAGNGTEEAEWKKFKGSFISGLPDLVI